MLQHVSETSVQEIEKLIAELQISRDMGFFSVGESN
jgi:hypothetical protein